jgi:hypothetical protein
VGQSAEVEARETVDPFNARMAGYLLRNFGTLVLLEASRQLQPGLGEIDPTAALDVSIVRTRTDAGPVVFPPKNFPDNDPVPERNIALEQPDPFDSRGVCE